MVSVIVLHAERGELADCIEETIVGVDFILLREEVVPLLFC